MFQQIEYYINGFIKVIYFFDRIELPRRSVGLFFLFSETNRNQITDIFENNQQIYSTSINNILSENNTNIEVEQNTAYLPNGALNSITLFSSTIDNTIFAHGYHILFDREETNRIVKIEVFDRDRQIQLFEINEENRLVETPIGDIF